MVGEAANEPDCLRVRPPLPTDPALDWRVRLTGLTGVCFVALSAAAVGPVNFRFRVLVCFPSLALRGASAAAAAVADRCAPDERRDDMALRCE